MKVLVERIEKEKKKARLKAWLINSAFLFMGLYSLTYLIDGLQGGWALLWILLASLGTAFPWTLAGSSPGRILAERTNAILKNHLPRTEKGWIRSFSGLLTLAIALLTLIMGWQITEISLREFFSLQGLQGAKNIFLSIFTPELGIIGQVLEAMVVTIFIALLATLFAIPFAFLLSFFMARNLMRGSGWRMTAYNGLRLVFNFTRSLEPIIWAIIFSVWVGIGPFAGMIALWLHSIAALAKLYSEQVEDVNQGPLEAMQATGANRLQVVWFAVVPQIILPFISFTIYRWDINIRMATIIGLVGGGGIGTLLMQYQGLARWHEVGTCVLVIAIVVWVMDYLSAKIREAIY